MAYGRVLMRPRAEERCRLVVTGTFGRCAIDGLARNPIDVDSCPYESGLPASASNREGSECGPGKSSRMKAWATATAGLHAVRIVFGRFAVARSLPMTVFVSLGIQLANLASGVVLARALGPVDRGELAIAMLWPTLIAGLGLLGVSDAVVYLVGRDGDRSAEVLSGSLLVGVIQGALLLGLGWLIVPYVLAGKPADVVNASLFYLWFIPLVPLTGYPLALFQGRLLLAPFNLARASVHIFYTAALLAMWLAHGVTIRSALVASLVASCLTLLLTFWLVVTRVPLRPRLSLGVIRLLLTYGAKLHIGNVATLIVQRADLLALTLLAPAAVLGNYVVASAIGVGAGLIPTAASIVLFPAFSNREESDYPRSVARFLMVAGGFTVVAGPVLTLLLPWTLPILFGPAYAPAVSTAMILVLAYLVRGWNQMLFSILRGTGHPLSASTAEAGGLVVMIILLAFLVPRYAGSGAAVSVLVGACATLTWVVLRTLSASRLTTQRMFSFWSSDLAVLLRLVRQQRATGS